MFDLDEYLAETLEDASKSPGIEASTVPLDLDAGRGDSLVGGDASDAIFDGWGNDTLFSDDAADALFGGLDGDTITGGSPADTIFDSRDADTIVGDFGGDTIFGSLDGDTITGDVPADTIFGSHDADTIVGGHSADTINGDLGGDTITGDSLADTICCSDAADTVFGGKAGDWIFEEPDSDAPTRVDVTPQAKTEMASLSLVDLLPDDSDASLDQILQASDGSSESATNVVQVERSPLGAAEPMIPIPVESWSESDDIAEIALAIV